MTGSPMMEGEESEWPVDPLAWVAQHEISELKARPLPSTWDPGYSILGFGTYHLAICTWCLSNSC